MKIYVPKCAVNVKFHMLESTRCDEILASLEAMEENKWTLAVRNNLDVMVSFLCAT